MGEGNFVSNNKNGNSLKIDVKKDTDVDSSFQLTPDSILGIYKKQYEIYFDVYRTSKYEMLKKLNHFDTLTSNQSIEQIRNRLEEVEKSIDFDNIMNRDFLYKRICINIIEIFKKSSKETQKDYNVRVLIAQFYNDIKICKKYNIPLDNSIYNFFDILYKSHNIDEILNFPDKDTVIQLLENKTNEINRKFIENTKLQKQLVIYSLQLEKILENLLQITCIDDAEDKNIDYEHDIDALLDAITNLIFDNGDEFKNFAYCLLKKLIKNIKIEDIKKDDFKATLFEALKDKKVKQAIYYSTKKDVITVEEIIYTQNPNNSYLDTNKYQKMDNLIHCIEIKNEWQNLENDFLKTFIALEQKIPVSIENKLTSIIENKDFINEYNDFKKNTHSLDKKYRLDLSKNKYLLQKKKYVIGETSNEFLNIIIDIINIFCRVIYFLYSLIFHLFHKDTQDILDLLNQYAIKLDYLERQNFEDNKDIIIYSKESNKILLLQSWGKLQKTIIVNITGNDNINFTEYQFSDANECHSYLIKLISHYTNLYKIDQKQLIHLFLTEYLSNHCSKKLEQRKKQLITKYDQSFSSKNPNYSFLNDLLIFIADNEKSEFMSLEKINICFNSALLSILNRKTSNNTDNSHSYDVALDIFDVSSYLQSLENKNKDPQVNNPPYHITGKLSVFEKIGTLITAIIKDNVIKMSKEGINLTEGKKYCKKGNFYFDINNLRIALKDFMSKDLINNININVQCLMNWLDEENKNIECKVGSNPYQNELLVLLGSNQNNLSLDNDFINTVLKNEHLIQSLLYNVILSTVNQDITLGIENKRNVIDNIFKCSIFFRELDVASNLDISEEDKELSAIVIGRQDSKGFSMGVLKNISIDMSIYDMYNPQNDTSRI